MPATEQILLKNIMLIDDNDTDLFICQKVLQMTDPKREITSFTSAQDALENLKISTIEKIPDTIFLDINMPGMNGFMFLMEFENLPQEIISSCKIIVLSSSNSSKDINSMKENPHVVCFLTKPLNTEYLKKLQSLQYK